MIICCILLSGCRSGQSSVTPSIEFSKVPLVDEGGTAKIAAIEGRVIGARPGQQIVLFARSGAWYAQPFTDQPFTKIQPDSTWRNSTHLGTEYAALLVEPGYRPPASTDVLPNLGDGVAAVAIVPGEVRLMVPVFWNLWWFRVSGGLAFLFALLALHRLRLRQLTGQLNARFEERLAERTLIAQEIHDTLLQGFLSASMQLHVAADQIPGDSPAKPRLDHIQQLMAQVIEEGRNTIRGMRSSGIDDLDIELAFDRIRQELAINKTGSESGEQVEFRVVVKGRPRPLHPILRDEIYRIGREALVNACRHARAKSVEVEVEYAASHLRILIRDDGCGIAPQALSSGSAPHSGLSSMRERAEGIGARLKIRQPARGGTEVELSIPSHIAFQMHSSTRPRIWFIESFLRRAGAAVKRLKNKIAR
ncbi:MAG: sensor histidine kinase [Acidobacteriota bacterium]